MNTFEKLFNILLPIITLLFWSNYAYSDWYLSGAAAKCTDGKSLLIIPADRSSGDSPGYNPVPKGYRELKGRSTLSCNIGKAKAKAVIHVYPPAARGEGMGGGYVSIDNFTINGLPLFGGPTAFDWQIQGSAKAIEKITVFLKDGIPIVEVCDTKCQQVSLGDDMFLNSTYERLISNLPQSERKKLREEQRFWLKTRNPTCQYEIQSNLFGNGPLAFLKCLMLATSARGQILLNYQIYGHI